MSSVRTVLGVSLILSGAAAGLSAQQPDGAALYRENCRTCHGTAGKPTQRALSQYPKIPTMDSMFFGGRSADSIVTILTRGKGKDMKSFTAKLTPSEMRAVADYIRSTFGSPKP